MMHSRRKLEKARREAAIWHTKLKAAREQDRDVDTLVPRFCVWLDARPENRVAFERQQALCHELELSDDLRISGLRKPATSSESPPHTQSEWTRSHPGFLTIAFIASALGLGSGAAFYARNEIACAFGGAFLHGRCATPLEKRISPPGELVQWALADGTHVSLNGELTADIDMGKPRRHVFLIQGEACFEVVKAGVPFDVTVGPVLVRAIGTAFAVRKIGAYGSRTVVQSGKVEIFGPNGQHILLERGEVAEFDGEYMRGPMRDLLNLQGVTLGEAARLFNRYNTDTVFVVDTSVARQRIGGQFSAQDPEGFADDIGRIFGIPHSVSHDPVQGTEIIHFGGHKRPDSPPGATAALSKGS